MAQLLSIAFTPTPQPITLKLACYCTRQLSAGVARPSQSEYRLVQVSGVSQASPLDITAAYTAKFGALVTGKKIFTRIIPISITGIRGVPFDVVNTIA